MKFTVGDPVRLKATGEEGTIVRFMKAGMVEVEVAGIQFPVFEDEVEHPYLHWFTSKPARKKRTTAAEEPPALERRPAPRRAAGLHLSFVPQIEAVEGEDLVQACKIFVHAELAFAVRVTYECTLRGRTLFELSTTLQPFAALHLHTLDLPTLNDQPRFGWRAQPVEGQRLGPVGEGVLRIKPPQLFEKLSGALSGGDPTFSYLLTENFTAPPEAPLPLPVFTGGPERMVVAPMPPIAEPVVDLHAQQLIPGAVDYSPGEILRIQLRAAEAAVEDAYAAGSRRLVLVHGVGGGALRAAVQSLLRSLPVVEKFSDEWHPRFGFGATVVTLRA